MLAAIHNSSGFVLWLLGPTSSGKTTIAQLLLNLLRKNGIPVLHYDGDEVRDFFGDNLSFRPADRLRVVGTLTHLANKATSAGVNAVVSALTANEDARELIRENIPNLITCYVKCSIETCISRDPKGLYGMAKRGEINTLIGINENYVAPKNPDIVINTERHSAAEAVDILVAYLHKNNCTSQLSISE